MDETANQMSDVRDELVKWFTRDIAHTGKSPSEVADAILARWDLTEKPVVTDKQLGEYAMKSVKWSAAETDVGERFRTYLDEAGLMIVRTEDGER